MFEVCDRCRRASVCPWRPELGRRKEAWRLETEVGGGVRCDWWGFDVDDVNIWAHATTPTCQLWLWTRPAGGLTPLSSCLRPPPRPLLPRSNSQRTPPPSLQPGQNTHQYYTK